MLAGGPVSNWDDSVNQGEPNRKRKPFAGSKVIGSKSEVKLRLEERGKSCVFRADVVSQTPITAILDTSRWKG
jgi:hypothetical protein